MRAVLVAEVRVGIARPVVSALVSPVRALLPLLVEVTVPLASWSQAFPVAGSRTVPSQPGPAAKHQVLRVSVEL